MPPGTDVTFLPMEKIGEDGTLSLDETRTIEQVWQGYTYFRDGDVVVAKITPCFENGKGARVLGLVNGIGFGTTELHVLRTIHSVFPDFLFYLTRSQPMRKLGAAAMHGAAGQQRVPEQFLKDFSAGFPPISEQRAISAFLDRETARIDALIAKKERQIELLQEKRAALISHVVTKGLDPDVPMKDSGIEWLGVVPAHWQVRRLKFIARVQSGVAKGRKLSGQATLRVPYLRVANVQQGHVDLTDVATITIHDSELERYSLRNGDVLLTEGGDYDKLGRGTVWEGQIDPCIHQNHIFAVRPQKSVNPDWIAAITQSSYARHFFILRSKQSTNLASISSTNLMDLPVVLPPEGKRGTILTSVGDRVKRLDAISAKIHESTVRLLEYRTALISAAVTGKIDVRDEPVRRTSEVRCT